MILDSHVSTSRTAVKDVKRRWPNGVIPYQFYNGPDPNLIYEAAIKDKIEKVRSQSRFFLYCFKMGLLFYRD